MTFLVSALIFVITVTAYARIGETEDAIAQRYGKPIILKDGYNARHKIGSYEFKNYAITVDFIDGRSAREYFKTKDRTPLSAEERQVILAANGDLNQWVLTAGNEVVNYWDYRLGGTLSAFFDDRRCSALLELAGTQAFLERAKADQARGL